MCVCELGKAARWLLHCPPIIENCQLPVQWACDVRPIRPFVCHLRISNNSTLAEAAAVGRGGGGSATYQVQ